MDSAREGVSAGYNSVSAKTKESLEVASSVTKEGFEVVVDKTSQGMGMLSEGLSASGAVLKTKLDEAGITETATAAAGTVAEGAKFAGGYVYEKGAIGVSMLNEKIEEHETLAKAKRAAAEKASQATAYVSNFFGWGKPAEE